MNKIVRLDQLAELVPDGSTVGLGGAWLSNHPMAAVRQLVRDGARDLHVAETMGSVDIDLLVGAGALRHLTFSMVSLEIFGLAPNFRRAVETQELTITEMTGCALNTAIDAAARNVPFLPLAPLGSSEVPARQRGMYAEIRDPFTGVEVLAIRALRPDVAIVHALRADRAGNAQSDGPLAIDPELCRAAGRVVVTCEEIVSRELVESAPHMTTIPGFLVDAVIEAPFGAHPTSHVPRYGFDAWEVRDYATAARDPASWQSYLAELRSETEEQYRKRVLPAARAAVVEGLARSATSLAAPVGG